MNNRSRMSQMDELGRDIREAQDKVDKIITELGCRWRIEVTNVELHPIMELGKAYPVTYRTMFHWKIT